ncbi:O-methyltransferase [Mycobacterium shigaense]|uniref:O-methyltransferase n=2 Tax=Mycobacterium shigaense TaxID=722731 RepID=A0A1Z4EC64_9MYCO|nr:O-methyltransferase [Mycobacterium shigaense]
MSAPSIPAEQALLHGPGREASVDGMSQTPTPQDVDAFLDSTTIGDDPALAAALEDSDAAGLPHIAVSAQQGKFLSLLAGAIQARRILEIGTLGGFSTIWLARGVGPQGRVVTLEYEPKHAEVARANLRRAGVADRVEVVVGAALDTLPAVTGGPFDLIFVDADKENYPAYLDWAVKLARPGSVIVLDNVIRDGQILTPEHADERVRATRRTLELMGEHPRLDTAVIQTVGAKHWDGFALATVK